LPRDVAQLIRKPCPAELELVTQRAVFAYGIHRGPRVFLRHAKLQEICFKVSSSGVSLTTPTPTTPPLTTPKENLTFNSLILLGAHHGS
jgi:hypothetical protein